MRISLTVYDTPDCMNFVVSVILIRIIYYKPTQDTTWCQNKDSFYSHSNLSHTWQVLKLPHLRVSISRVPNNGPNGFEGSKDTV